MRNIRRTDFLNFVSVSSMIFLLEFRWLLFLLYCWAQGAKPPTEQAPVAYLQWVWLRQQLRRYPYWVKGHFRFAENSIVLAKNSYAYSSAQAVQQLAPHSSHAHQATLIVARCCIQNMELERATELLQSLLERSPKLEIEYQAKEFMADCMLLDGNIDRAIELLESIPEGHRSSSGLAALRYAHEKLTSSAMAARSEQ